MTNATTGTSHTLLNAIRLWAVATAIVFVVGCSHNSAKMPNHMTRVQYLEAALKSPNLPPPARAEFEKEYEADTHLPAPSPTAVGSTPARTPAGP